MAEGRKHRLSFKQLRLLFARGILRGRGTGKNRKVEYTKGATGNGASAPAKRDFSATRVARVGAGLNVAQSASTLGKLNSAIQNSGPTLARMAARGPKGRADANSYTRRLHGAKIATENALARAKVTPEQRQARTASLSRALATGRARDNQLARDTREAAKRAAALRSGAAKPQAPAPTPAPKPATTAPPKRSRKRSGPVYSGPTREQEAAWQRQDAPRYVAGVRAAAQGLAAKIGSRGRDQASLFGDDPLAGRAQSRLKTIAKALKRNRSLPLNAKERAYDYAMAYRLLGKGR